MAISIKKQGGSREPLPTSTLGVQSGSATQPAANAASAATPTGVAAPFFAPPGAGSFAGSAPGVADAAERHAPPASARPPSHVAPPADVTVADGSLSTTMVEQESEVPSAIYRTGRSGLQLGPGDVVDDRYRIKAPLGAGGMAQVWLAEHIAIEKLVAIKALAPKGASTNPEGQLAERFLREAKATAAIKHSGVVDITDFGRLPSGMPYFVMEHLEGATLHEQIVNSGPMHWLDARDTLVELADALIAAHDQGIVHCDLKPSNIFVLGPPGQHTLKIIDFGIAKLTQQSAYTKNITTPGMVTGTPTYMSPEQTRGRKLDARTDIYALGCIAYFVMNGRPPFEAEANATLLKMQLYSKPTPLRELVPGVPAEVERLVSKALEKDPEDRFQTMTELRDALAASGEDFEYEPREAKPYVREDAKTLIRKLEKPLKVGTSKHPLAAGPALQPPPPSDATTVIPGGLPRTDSPQGARPSDGEVSRRPDAAASSRVAASASAGSLGAAERSGISAAAQSSARQPIPSQSMRSPAPVRERRSPLVPALVFLLILAAATIGYLVATR